MNNDMQNRWNADFDKALRRHYGISLDEAAINPLHLMAWRAMYPGEPDHAVWAYGASMKLEPMMSVLGGERAISGEEAAFDSLLANWGGRA